MVDESAPEGNEAYLADERPPWEIGRPQPAIIDLAEEGLISGRVLDVGCGTGEHARHLARHGHSVTGIDLSAQAIELARKKTNPDTDVRFYAEDIFAYIPEEPYETVVGSLLLHTFDAETRVRYTDHLHELVAPTGVIHVLSFSERAVVDGGLVARQ